MPYNTLKGDDNIKITFKVYGTGYNDSLQATIQIFDNNILVCEEQTYNGILNIELCPNKIYKIKAYLLNNIIVKIIYTNTNEYKLEFPYVVFSRESSFLLRDYYYNLPIERGMIILWQKQ